MWVPRLPLMSEVGTPLVETPSSRAITPQLTKAQCKWLQFLVVERDAHCTGRKPDGLLMPYQLQVLMLKHPPEVSRRLNDALRIIECRPHASPGGFITLLILS